MGKRTSVKENTVILSDDYLRESGVQGGKILGEHIVIGCFLMGIPFLIIGLYALLSMIGGVGYPVNTALVIGAFLVMVIGMILILGGFYIYRENHKKK